MTDKLDFWHRPDWHPTLTELMGQIVGQQGYVTEHGTIRILGPIHEDPDFPKAKSSSKQSGPTVMLTAKSSLGFA